MERTRKRERERDVRIAIHGLKNAEILPRGNSWNKLNTKYVTVIVCTVRHDNGSYR